MTISKPRNNSKYSIDKDPPKPKFITVGVTLITKECHDLIIDNRHVQVPVEDEIVYASVPYEVAHGKDGCADWDAIAELLEKEGYLRKHYSIQSVWIPVADHVADEIF